VGVLRPGWSPVRLPRCRALIVETGMACSRKPPRTAQRTALLKKERKQKIDLELRQIPTEIDEKNKNNSISSTNTATMARQPALLGLFLSTFLIPGGIGTSFAQGPCIPFAPPLPRSYDHIVHVYCASGLFDGETSRQGRGKVAPNDHVGCSYSRGSSPPLCIHPRVYSIPCSRAQTISPSNHLTTSRHERAVHRAYA